MNTDQLTNFIKTKMSVSHIYQPMIILVLLENGGEASVEEVARRCAELRGENPEMYAARLTKYPKEALLKHGVLVPSARNTFKLALDATALSDASSQLISACTERLQRVK